MSDTPFRVLVLCAHNRTRSVMAAALLRHHLGDDPRFVIETAGFNDEGLPALPEAVALLAEHGMDVSGHVSRKCTAEMVRQADLVLCAEKKQVLSVVADCGGDFATTFTLPEFAASLSLAMPRPTGFGYIASSVGEVEDPTGRTHGVWLGVYANLDMSTRSVATALLKRVNG